MVEGRVNKERLGRARKPWNEEEIAGRDAFPPIVFQISVGGKKGGRKENDYSKRVSSMN